MSGPEFSKYINSITSKLPMDPWVSILTHWLMARLTVLGGICSIIVVCSVTCSSIYSAVSYIRTTRIANVTASMWTIMKLLCCQSYLSHEQNAQRQARQEEMASRQTGMLVQPTAPGSGILGDPRIEAHLQHSQLAHCAPLLPQQNTAQPFSFPKNTLGRL